MKPAILRFCSAVTIAVTAATAHAATTETWNLTSGGNTASPYGNTSTYVNANGKSLTLRAFYADGLSNVTGTIGDTTRNSTLQTNTRNAALKFGNGTTQAGVATFDGNGIGIANPYDGPQSNGQENSTGGQHAIDNYDTNSTGSVLTTGLHAHDFLLMDFNEVMELNSFRIGWKRYANTGIDFFVAPESVTNPVIAGSSISTLLANQWKQISFDNVSDCTPDPGSASCPTQFGTGSGFTAGMKSRYIIAAGALGGNDDAFKFSQITMTSSSGGQIPLPGTAALLAAGVLGLAWARRKPTSKSC